MAQSTYATTIRDSKRTRERDFLQQVRATLPPCHPVFDRAQLKSHMEFLTRGISRWVAVQQVHECVNNGGKVLIPVFALGRAQELAILVEEYWQRCGLTVPVYFSAGLTSKVRHRLADRTESAVFSTYPLPLRSGRGRRGWIWRRATANSRGVQANLYYKLLVSWTNQQVKATHDRHNVFDFKHVQPFDRSYIERPGPCVLFASPGMVGCHGASHDACTVAPGPGGRNTY
jgi:integrator complex subunit 11